MMVGITSSDSYIAVKRFLRDHPNWRLVLAACVTEAKRTTGGFAGSWVLKELQHQTNEVQWFPNLRPLVAAGILKRTGGSRGGKRAYYEMIDVEAVSAALAENVSVENAIR